MDVFLDFELFGFFKAETLRHVLVLYEHDRLFAQFERPDEIVCDHFVFSIFASPVLNVVTRDAVVACVLQHDFALGELGHGSPLLGFVNPFAPPLLGPSPGFGLPAGRFDAGFEPFVLLLALVRRLLALPFLGDEGVQPLEDVLLGPAVDLAPLEMACGELAFCPHAVDRGAGDAGEGDDVADAEEGLRRRVMGSGHQNLTNSG
jgi:hypothetical protein